MAKKAKYDTEVTDTSPAVNQVSAAEVAGDDQPSTPKAPKLNYHLTLSVDGAEPIPCLFAKRDWLKREHPTKEATLDGEPTTVVIISAREFADNRVWIKLPNGDNGRFLVPKEVNLEGALAISTVEGPIKYDREAIRVRPKVERKKKEVAAEGAVETTEEAQPQ